MNIFKMSYKIKRENNDEIYKGFGFRHLSDVTQYYVHPNNQSYKGTTTLCQPIGEAISLFSLLLSTLSLTEAETVGDNAFVRGDSFISEEKDKTFLHIIPSQDWRTEGIIESNIYAYRVLVKEETISLGAYNKEDKFIADSMEDLPLSDKLLPCFAALLARDTYCDEDFSSRLFEYVDNPAADTFVNIHEDFYQQHKFDDYNLIYEDIKNFDLSAFVSFSETYSIIKSNKETIKTKQLITIKPFNPLAFDANKKLCIPLLASEFKLPEFLISVCNAIVQGDTLAVLLHGPSGTGKTMSCQLICREIGLPIMETINCTENLDEFILGKFLPEGEKIVFKESYVTKAIREGGAVVFEEINFAKPAYLAFLNALLDDNGFVRLDNGETVKRHKHFRFFATMNFGYFGTKELNQALYNRFNNIVEITALSDEAIKRMLEVRVPECAAFMDKILGVYHKLKKKIEIEELDVVISPRNLENWAKLAKYEGYLHAAEKTIIPIAKCDRLLEETIRGILMLYKWC